MKIAVTATQPDLTGPIDPRFGRCGYFLIVDTETGQFEAHENPHGTATSGAGIQAAQFVIDKGAKVVLTGSCGPNAFQTLQAAGVEVIVGVSGSIQEALEKYKSGHLQPTSQPNAPSHFGVGSTDPGAGFQAGFGRGMGMGRGMGPGRGMGMGRRQGPGFGGGPGFPGGNRFDYPPPPPPPPTGEVFPPAGPLQEELAYLRQQTEIIQRQLAEILSRLEALEKKDKK